jgi:hypothetical protein
LAKIQMLAFTTVAIGIFLATVIHQIVTNDIAAGLPDIDASLMVLMGISNGGYLGKKLVTFGTPGATGQFMPPGQVATPVQNGSDGKSPGGPSPSAPSPSGPSPSDGPGQPDPAGT